MGTGPHPDEEQYERAFKIYHKDTSSEGLYTPSQLQELGLTDQNGQKVDRVSPVGGEIYYLGDDIQTEFSSDDTDAEGNQYGQHTTYGSDGTESTTSNSRVGYRIRAKAVSGYKEYDTSGQGNFAHLYKYYLEPVTGVSRSGGSTYSTGNEAQGESLESTSSSNNSGILSSSGYTKKQSTLGAAEGGLLGTAVGSMLSTALLMSGLNEMNRKSKQGG